MSLKNIALKGIVWSFLQLSSNQIISFSVNIVLARLLMPKDFGLIAMLSVFIGIGNALINSGLSSSLIRSEEIDEEDYTTVFYFNLLGSFMIYSLFFIAAPYIAKFYEQDLLITIIRVYGLTFIINAFSTIQTTRLTKLMDFKTQMKVSVPSLIVSGTLGICLANLNYGVWSLVYMAICQSIISSIQLWYWAKWKPLWCFKKNKFKKHFKFGTNLLFSSVLDILYSSSYTIIIGKFFAPAQVGYFNRADTLQMLPVGNISTIITKVSYPLFSTIQNDNIKLKQVYKRIMEMVLYLVVPILLIMSALAEPLFRFLFTDKWLPAVPYFRILCLTGILYPIHSYNLQILKVKGRSDLFFKLEIIKKIIMTIVLIISFQYGIYGLLYGSIITSVIAFFINTHYSGKFLNYTAWEQFKDLLPTILIGMLIGFCTFKLDILFHKYTDFVRLILGTTIGLSSYLLTTYLLRINAFFEIIKILRRR
ncbi:oligosaccharide flippase family protein [Flavobacterium sp. TP390]|uniref:Oligosaccharide flippase family protein n=1 Tax=Flavobacterium profundi TaxID=1774945 RepID=A0A6I4IDU2_9FLAO|nr:lipopolysaccharide biosynthesis protein [Flavobacterium profundi]MVO07728.1 oligosaccharide flippase family protein [Flavobacterium profundi]